MREGLDHDAAAWGEAECAWIGGVRVRRSLGEPAFSGARAGFSLVDLLVAMAVMGVLVSVLLPALSAARDAAERAACASNIRQLGLGLTGYAFDNDDRLPPSRVTDGTIGVEGPRPQDSVILRYEAGAEAIRSASLERSWDGLGLLFESSLVPAPPVFYCPAHTGEHPLERYQSLFYERRGEIVGNYQYRGDVGGDRVGHLSPHVSLIAGSMRAKSEYSHISGHNYFRADLSVDWFADLNGELFASLPEPGTPPDEAADAVNNAWHQTDTASSGARRGGDADPDDHGESNPKASSRR